MTTSAQNGSSHDKGVICFVEGTFLLLFLPDSVAPKSVTQCLVFPVQETSEVH